MPDPLSPLSIYTTRVSWLTCGKLLQQQVGTNGSSLNTFNWTSTTHRVYSATPLRSHLTMQYFPLVGLDVQQAADGWKKAWCVCDGSLHCLVTSKSSTKNTPTASTKPAPDCFMPSPQLKTFSSSALMSPTLFPKLHHQSKASTSIPTKPSSTGGLTIRNSLPSHLDLSSQSTLPCKDIQNHHDFGKNTLMPYYKYKTSAIHRTRPCLYSGLINNTHVVLMRQVNDFAIVSPVARCSYSYSPPRHDWQ